MAIPTTAKAQIEAWHKLFCQMAELTKDAETMTDVAQRFIAAGMVATEEPSVSICDPMNESTEFFEILGDQLWQRDKDPLWANEPDPESGSSEVH